MKDIKAKKLDIEDRMTLQGCLHAKYRVSQISKILKVNKTTVYRELKRNSRFVEGDDHECETRKKLIVCNNCRKKAYCNIEKKYYDYKFAQTLTNNRRKETRNKPRLETNKIVEIDEIVKDGVNLGQSLHHIYVSNPILNKICSEKTIRRLVYRGNLTIKPYQLRRYLVQKRTYSKEYETNNIRDIRIMIGRTFKGYKRAIKYSSKNNVQYDSVIGKRSDKNAILTITFPKYNFQFGLLIKKSLPFSVKSELKKLFKKVGEAKVKEVFAINLCDNGVEFSRFNEIELNDQGEKIIRTFFTTPYRSTDKAECERNHEFIRYCISKGKTFDNLTQEQINEMFSNINSYVRKKLGDKTPYQLVKKAFGIDFLNSIGIREINLKRVRLNKIV